MLGYFFFINSEVPSIDPLSITITSYLNELSASGIDSRQRFK